MYGRIGCPDFRQPRFQAYLHFSPAMEAGVACHVWEAEEVIAHLSQKGVEAAA